MLKHSLALLLLSLLAGVALAQVDRGEVTGTITDPTGAVIAGAAVTVTNVETGVHFTTTSNEVGLYSVLNLQAGKYAVSFTKQGFKKLERPMITLAVAQVAQVDVRLQIGSGGEVVTVTDEAPLLQTQESHTGTDLKYEVVNDLPISVAGGRQMQIFAYDATPSVEGDPYDSRIGGSQTFTTEVTIDGTSTNAQIQGDLMETTPSPDAVQEFVVETSGVSAENGRGSGGTFLFTMKSGTNQWHGTASYYLHNELFDANTWDNGWKGLRKPYDRFHDYSLAGGGPIIKNKTFFYVAFDKYKQQDYRLGPLNATVPTAAFLGGDFGALLDKSTVLGADSAGNTIYKGAIFDPTTKNVFVNNVVPSGRLSTVSNKIVGLYQKYYPPVGSSLFNNNAELISQTPLLTPWDFSYKVDHNFSDKNRLSTSWIYHLQNRTMIRTENNSIWGAGTTDGGPLALSRSQSVVGNQWRASDSHTFTPNVLNVLSATYNEYKNAGPALSAGGNWPSQLGFGNTGAGNFPKINFGTANYGWNESPIGDWATGGYVGDNFIVDDAVSWLKGRHTMKFGGDFRAMQISSKGGAGVLSFDFDPTQTSSAIMPGGGAFASQTGFGFASFMLGAVQQAAETTPYDLYGRRKYLAFFAQDDFRVTNRLTLNLGLRWETDFPFHEKYGNWANFNLTSMNPLWGIPGAMDYATSGTSFEKNMDWKQFGPHLGFAYRVNNKIVARGSYAILYVPLGIDYWFGVPYGYAPQAMITNNVPKNGTAPAFYWDNGYPGVPVPATKDTSGQVPPGVNYAPTTVDPDSLSLGYIHQFSFGVQYEVAKDTKLDISYLGNRGHRLHDGTLDYDELNAQTYLNWYNTYGSHAYDWVWDPTSAAAAGVPWYPNSTYYGYGAYTAESPFPQVTTAYEPLYYVGTPKGKSFYDALQVEVSRRAGHGVMLDMSYVYSASRGDTGSAFDESWALGAIQDYSKLDQEAHVLLPYDQKHVVKGYVSYDLPFGHGRQWLGSANGFVNAVVGNWKLSAIVRYNSGFPISLSSTNYYPGWAAVYPNITTGADFSSHFKAGQFQPWNPGSSTNQYFSPSIASDPANGTLGTGPVRLDALRGFGKAYEDAALMKSFSFGPEERFRLSTRFQLYNIFNRHYFADPNGVAGSSAFGLVPGTLSTATPRQGQFDVRLEF